MTIKELIASGNVVRFRKYFDGQLWYQVHTPDASEDDRYRAIGPEFPVPVSDVGNATFLAEDKAILFMRYIRKHLDTLKEAKQAQEV